jgi:hypothetical protein
MIIGLAEKAAALVWVNGQSGQRARPREPGIKGLSGKH